MYEHSNTSVAEGHKRLVWVAQNNDAASDYILTAALITLVVVLFSTLAPRFTYSPSIPCSAWHAHFQLADVLLD